MDRAAGTMKEGPRRPNARMQYEVGGRDLPLHCPLPGMPLWSSHPKVYLPIEQTGEAKCPYCGATYVLVGSEKRRSE